MLSDFHNTLGTAQSYAGSSGRVTHELLGRDLNPLGRGDGNAYVAGSCTIYSISPALPSTQVDVGTGNSVNNQYMPDSLNVPQAFNTFGQWFGLDFTCYHKWRSDILRNFGLPGSNVPCISNPCGGRPCPCTLCSGHDWVADPRECFNRYCSCDLLFGCAEKCHDNIWGFPCDPLGDGYRCGECGGPNDYCLTTKPTYKFSVLNSSGAPAGSAENFETGLIRLYCCLSKSSHPWASKLLKSLENTPIVITDSFTTSLHYYDWYKDSYIHIASASLYAPVEYCGGCRSNSAAPEGSLD